MIRNLNSRGHQRERLDSKMMISVRATPALNDRGYYSWLEVSQRGQAGGEGVLTPQYKGDHKYTNTQIQIQKYTNTRSQPDQGHQNTEFE